MLNWKKAPERERHIMNMLLVGYTRLLSLEFAESPSRFYLRARCLEPLGPGLVDVLSFEELELERLCLQLQTSFELQTWNRLCWSREAPIVLAETLLVERDAALSARSAGAGKPTERKSGDRVRPFRIPAICSGGTETEHQENGEAQQAGMERQQGARRRRG